MRRLALLSLLLLLVVGCGGGGGSDPTPAGDAGGDTVPAPAPQPDVLLEQTMAILQSCTLAELSGLVDLLDLFQGVAEEGGAIPSFLITGFSLTNASVDWTVDLDLDETADVSGTVSFSDADGKPTLPFNPLDLLLGGSFDVPGLLEAIQDGTVVGVEYAVLRGVDTTGSLAFGVSGGLPSAVSGDLLVNGTDCVIRAEFEALEIDPMLGAYPTGNADVSVEGGDASLAGTVSFDGTSAVGIDMALPGEASYGFTYDLLTGELTPAGS